MGSVALPDSSFIDIAEVTGLAPKEGTVTPRPVYQTLREAIAENARLYREPQDAARAAQAPGGTAAYFSIEGYRLLRRVGEGATAAIYLAEAGARRVAKSSSVTRTSNLSFR